MQSINNIRRRWLMGLGAFSSAWLMSEAQAHHTDTHFEDDTTHKLVMNCNKADEDYIAHTLFSVGELIRKYGDDVHVIVECYGPGIHLLGKAPGRPIDKAHQGKASSLAQYGVGFHACGNTMKSLKWGEDDLLAFATVVEAGIDDMMLLQEKGFAYAGW